MVLVLAYLEDEFGVTFDFDEIVELTLRSRD